ncbi:hypothetical protein ACLMJK_002502 [Lecanora helva]
MQLRYPTLFSIASLCTAAFATVHTPSLIHLPSPTPSNSTSNASNLTMPGDWPNHYRRDVGIFTVLFHHYGRRANEGLKATITQDLQMIRDQFFDSASPADWDLPLHIGLVEFDILVPPILRGEVDGREVASVIAVVIDLMDEGWDAIEIAYGEMYPKGVPVHVKAGFSIAFDKV